ncbi:MAG TPA: limonene-1,2-epoxide hydrolase family protein [Acidimicrobiia bacterium]|nr:limonene-1,2-epoxide hydrolase family protein [Acidimicrobiia bacterium]
MSNAIDLVREFCDAWGKGATPAELAAYFTDDAVYHNIPVAPVTGRAAIQSTIEMFTGGVERIEFRTTHIVADGPVVLTERVDVFFLANGTVELPVMGTFEVVGDKIAAWRDYFDLNQYMTQIQQLGS